MVGSNRQYSLKRRYCFVLHPLGPEDKTKAAQRVGIVLVKSERMSEGGRRFL